MEKWQLDEIKNCLQMARADLLYQYESDTPDELAYKEMKYHTPTTRYIDKCLKFIGEEDER